jgi:fructoselysine 6-kinase
MGIAKMKIVCIGDCGVDRYLSSEETYPGGITTNFARHARKCFHAEDEIHVISVLGDDGAPATLAYNAVNLPGICCHIRRQAGNTPVQYIEIKESGEKDFVKYDEGVLKSFRLDDEQIELLSTADLVVTPVFWQIHNVFDQVTAVPITGKLAVDFSDFSTNPNFDLLYSHLDKISIAIFGLDEGQNKLIEKISLIAESYDILMLVTLGGGGSMVFKGNHRHYHPAVEVKKVVDTTGAGDAFAAAFLGKFFRGGSIQSSLKAGARIAAKTIQHRGAG